MISALVTLEMALAESRLIILTDDGSDGIIYQPPKDKHLIDVGSDIACDIRYIQDEVRRKHFRIYLSNFGQVGSISDFRLHCFHFFCCCISSKLDKNCQLGHKPIAFGERSGSCRKKTFGFWRHYLAFGQENALGIKSRCQE